MLSKKIQKIQSILRTNKQDALFVGNFGHHMRDDLLYYLLLVHLEYGFMIISKKGTVHLYAISFEVEQYQKQFPEIQVFPLVQSPAELFKQYVHSGDCVAFRSDALPFSIHQQLKKTKLKLQKFNGTEHIIAVKSSEEIKLMQKTADITDALFAQLVRNWKTFFTEQDVAQYLLVEMARCGVVASFEPIIASGFHAALPHSAPHHKKIQKGFCVIDMGVRYKGYCSDMTRTIFVGVPLQKEKELYELVRKVQEDTVKLVHAGVSTKMLDTLCREQLGVLNKEFIHSLGHGVGTQVHEWPWVRSAEDVILEENMVITIEPGIYRQKKYGIRIEDDVLVTKTGQKILNKTTKELIVIK